MGSIETIWSNLASVQEAPDPLVIIAALLFSLVLISPPAWSYTRNMMTVAHEGGHAIIALLFGRRVSGIKLKPDTSGVTITSGRPNGIGAILTVFAGYTAPGFMGFGLALLLDAGRIAMAIAIITILLALMFLMIRNFWGFIIVAPSIIFLYWASGNVTQELQSFLLALIVWFLTLGSIRPIIELQLHRLKGETENSDADQLQKLTFIVPGTAWVFIFGLMSVVSVLLTVNQLII